MEDYRIKYEIARIYALTEILSTVSVSLVVQEDISKGFEVNDICGFGKLS